MLITGHWWVAFFLLLKTKSNGPFGSIWGVHANSSSNKKQQGQPQDNEDEEENDDDDDDDDDEEDDKLGRQITEITESISSWLPVTQEVVVQRLVEGLAVSFPLLLVP